jgi:hypothetical protein
VYESIIYMEHSHTHCSLHGLSAWSYFYADINSASPSANGRNHIFSALCIKMFLEFSNICWSRGCLSGKHSTSHALCKLRFTFVNNPYIWVSLFIFLRPISTQENFPRTENFPKISLPKVENFQFQNFFRRKICVGQSHFFKFFFPRKIFLSGNGPLKRKWT